jgi:NAD+ kinase
VIQLVPICPHTLSSRSLVVSGHAVLEILMKTPRNVRVRFDSHTHFDLLFNDKIIITRHPQSACILHPQDHSYYHTLREKMLWNQSL